MNTFQQALQEKPSQMITYALGALEEAEAVPHYRIDMAEWHTVHYDICFVCLGGAAAIKRAGKMGEMVDGTFALGPCGSAVDFYETALDDTRRGNIGSMFRTLKLDRVQGAAFDRYITPYSDSPTAFKADLRQLATNLAAAGY